MAARTRSDAPRRDARQPPVVSRHRGIWRDPCLLWVLVVSKRAWDVARQSEPGGVSDGDRSDQGPDPNDVHDPGQIVGQNR